MPKNPHADFSPVLDGYSGIGAFRFWCQTALPLTYDDSLSYYELLNKVVNYLNHTIEDLTAVESNTSALANAYDQLQKYVNDYFDDLDVEAELRNVLDAMAEDGTLDALLNPLVENQLPGVVDEKIDAVVAEQIDGAVAGQIDESVADQLPALVDAGIPEKVSDWLTENVDPVGSAVVVDSSLTISGAAADAKVTGDGLSDLKTQLNISVEYLGKGKNRISPTFIFGSLDTNGNIIDFVDNIRAVGKEYYTAVAGDVLILEPGYTIILCEYNSSEQLINRQIISSSNIQRQFTLNAGSLYRLCIWDANTSTQASPYQYAYKAYLPTDMQQDIDVLTEKAFRAMLALNNNQSEFQDADTVNKSIIFADTETGGIIHTPGEYGTFISFSPKSVLGTDTLVGNVQVWFPYGDSDFIYYRKYYNNAWMNWKRIPNIDYIAGIESDISDFKQQLDTAIPDVSMFETAAVIGDSFASGYMGITHVNQYSQSWLQVMARKHGLTAVNYSKDGQTARAWIATATRGLTAMLADTPKNLYIIALGLNDAFVYSQDSAYLGSEADMSDEDYDDNPDTFYGDMGRIIRNVQVHAPKAKIVIVTTPYGTYNGNSGAVNRTVDNVINDAITAIAEHFSLPLITTLSDPLFYSTEYKNNILTNGSHPTATMYSATANAYAKLIGRAMLAYESYFADYNTQA